MEDGRRADDRRPFPAERDRERLNAATTERLGVAEPRQPVDLVDVAPVKPNSADELNSETAPSNPGGLREDVLNTSTSSGLHPEDEANGRLIKEQARRGATEISRMD